MCRSKILRLSKEREDKYYERDVSLHVPVGT